VKSDVEEDLGQDGGDALVQDLAHDQREEPLLLPGQQRDVVNVLAELIQGAGGAAKHVQAGTHAVGVVPQSVDSVLLSDHQSILFGLLDEAQQERDRVRHTDDPRQTGVCCGEVVEQVDAELPHDLILVSVQLLGQHPRQLLDPPEGRRGQHEINVGFGDAELAEGFDGTALRRDWRRRTHVWERILRIGRR